MIEFFSLSQQAAGELELEHGFHSERKSGHLNRLQKRLYANLDDLKKTEIDCDCLCLNLGHFTIICAGCLHGISYKTPTD